MSKMEYECSVVYNNVTIILVGYSLHILDLVMHIIYIIPYIIN